MEFVSMEKVRIKNRKNQTIVVGLDVLPNAKGLSFVAHGLTVFKEQPQLETIKDALNENGYSVVRWDTTNAIGESDGKMEDATTTNYLEDLEDVIDWSKTQTWYREPFILTGHSLGGMISVLYAQKNPAKVKALAPISSAISFAFYLEKAGSEKLASWKQDGIKREPSLSRPGLIKSLKWNFVEDFKKYDLMKKSDTLRMPILVIVGEKDSGTPPAHQKLFFDSLKMTQKEMHVVEGCPHMFLEPTHLAELKRLFLAWLKKLN
jgi:pimeloyl-ACP methyl ester carboxylesterase